MRNIFNLSLLSFSLFNVNDIFCNAAPLKKNKTPVNSYCTYSAAIIQILYSLVSPSQLYFHVYYFLIF